MYAVMIDQHRHKIPHRARNSLARDQGVQVPLQPGVRRPRAFATQIEEAARKARERNVLTGKVSTPTERK